MVEVVDKRGKKAKVSATLARALVKMGRFSYLTTSLSEPAELPAPRTEKLDQLPTTATLEPKKRGRPKKVKDSETE